MITVRLKEFCACIGCWRKVNDALTGIQGIEGKVIDKKNCLVTITGKVDAEALRTKLAMIRKDVKVEIVFQCDKEEKKVVENKPKEKADTKDTIDKAEEESEETSPSKSNDSEAGPSNTKTRGENGAEPMVEQELEPEPARYPYGDGFDYGSNFPYGNGSSYDVPPYAYGNGPYKDLQAQVNDYGNWLFYGNGPHNYPAPQGSADSSGPNNYPPPQGSADGSGSYNDMGFSNACSIM